METVVLLSQLRQKPDDYIHVDIDVAELEGTSAETKAIYEKIKKYVAEHSNLDMFSLEMFENIAYIMAKHADPNILDTPEEWLDEFNTFSIYQVLPQLIQLWGLNIQTEVDAKKSSSNRP